MNAKFMIGWDIQDITPDKPVELIGQYYQRISKSVRDPLTVTALAIDSGTAQSVMVSMDILYISKDFLEEVREAVRTLAPDLDPKMISINATHIHSAPAGFVPFRWWSPSTQAMQPAEIRAFLVKRVVKAVENAWKTRKSGGVSSASAYAPTGFCRRMLYADGQAKMYGETNRDDFTGAEASNDPVVRMLFTWDEQNRMTGVVVNVACPSQIMEAQYVVSADFFGELRKRIRAAYGDQVYMLAQVSAAGDQSPRNLPAQSKDEVNYWNEAGVLATGQRLEKAVAEGYAVARDRIEHTPVFKHTVTNIKLPIRQAGTEEYKAAFAEVKRLTAGYPDFLSASRALFAEFVKDTHDGEKRQPHGPFDNKDLDFVQLENAQAVIKRFEEQAGLPPFSMELHAVRIGECAFVTNPFELYLDYGQAIIAQSRAKRTFVVQLACDTGRYLPTARAVAAKGYGAFIINGSVGPEGGRMLTEASVKAIDQLWKD
jgi:hypothetical protein